MDREVSSAARCSRWMVDSGKVTVMVWFAIDRFHNKRGTGGGTRIHNLLLSSRWAVPYPPLAFVTHCLRRSAQRIIAHGSCYVGRTSLSTSVSKERKAGDRQ